MDILDKIIAQTRVDLEHKKMQVPLAAMRQAAEIAPLPRSFQEAIRGEKIQIIAEIKRASPSKGLICTDFNPVAIARSYAEGGAAALSVLTEPHFFMGSLEYLQDVAAEVELPLLRKDFVIEEYQIYEARSYGASAILLIAAVLQQRRQKEFIRLAAELGLAALVEVHNEKEMELAVNAGAQIIGVNNRDLRSFTVSLETSEYLASMIPPDRLKVSESGILTRADVLHLQQAGYDAVLIGEALMRQSDRRKAVEALLGL